MILTAWLTVCGLQQCQEGVRRRAPEGPKMAPRGRGGVPGGAENGDPRGRTWSIMPRQGDRKIGFLVGPPPPPPGGPGQCGRGGGAGGPIWAGVLSATQYHTRQYYLCIQRRYTSGTAEAPIPRSQAVRITLDRRADRETVIVVPCKSQNI